MVLCCLCGVEIEPNDAMMCLNCLGLEVATEMKGQVDSIEKEVLQCPKCLKWKRDSISDTYFYAQWESIELLTHLTKRVRKLKQLTIVEAKFLWTEPHSKRIHICIVYEKDVLDRTKIRQPLKLEFHIRNKVCKSCSKIKDKSSWSSMVQIRQQANTTNLLLRLEKDLRDANAHLNATQIGSSATGLDVTFDEDKYAHEFVRFVRSHVPSSYQQTRKVISTDIRSGGHNIKYTHLLTVVPINVHDLVVLPAKLAASVGGVGLFLFIVQIFGL